MPDRSRLVMWFCGVLVLVVLGTGIGMWRWVQAQPPVPPASAPAKAGDQPPKPAGKSNATRTEVGPNVFLEVEGNKRRVLITAKVCLREGQLEQLLTRSRTKEHEAILAADVDARHVHAALLLTGAKAGSPVKFEPRYVPARGSKIKVSLRYEEKGKTVTDAAQEWVRVARTQKDLASDWVFGGSQFIANPLDPKKPDYFLANDGDIICVANFESALLDLPIESTQANADLVFEANTQRIPAMGTMVTIILEPRE